MRVISASVQNFGSYKELVFSFNNQGLTLISGPTGAGKSTLCDIIPWILFGVTSKGGSVDEIRNWTAEEDTEGWLYFEDGLEIYRRRGKTNDLHYLYENDTGTVSAQRGKDLNDTQKQINALLGMNADIYLSGAYFHEFSQSAQFFTTTAKNRRLITEQIVDMSLAKKVTENVSSYKKGLKKELEDLDKDLLLTEDRYKRSLEQDNKIKKQIEDWHERQASKILQAKANYDNFETNKKRAIDKLNASLAYETEQYNQLTIMIKERKRNRNEFSSKIEELNEKITTCDKEVCEHCGSPKQNDKRRQIVKDLRRFEDVHTTVIADLKHYDSELRRLEISIKLMNDSLIKERGKENTWQDQYDELTHEAVPTFGGLNPIEIKGLAKRITVLHSDINMVKTEISDLDLLSDVTDQFRSALIQNTITNLEQHTNKLLTDHFDAEIRVSFSADSSDKLDITVYKDGHQASFTQLSKGQRQLLKLCFGVSVMRSVSNHNGISFNAVFLDEVFNGMDENLKAKGFNLLQNLVNEYESVFAIDHSEELKSRFAKRYEVQLVNGESQIGEA